MNPKDLLQELSARPLICDGAMGTQLMARGLPTGSCGELWNVEHPEHVEAIHRAYRDAGCDLITTNTFGGCEPSLARHHLADRVRDLNKAGAEAASRAAGPGAWVLGDIGPFGGFLEPVGDMDRRMLAEYFRQQASSLLEGGADGLIVETMTDPEELMLAVHSCKEVASVPVVATFAFGRGEDKVFRTMFGTTVADAMDAAFRSGADIIGANCGTSLTLEDYLQLAEQLVAAANDKPVILQPNAGSPQMLDGKLHYPATPVEMAAIVQPLLKLGVRVIGGCCGTSPDHLRAMAAAVKGSASEQV